MIHILGIRESLGKGTKGGCHIHWHGPQLLLSSVVQGISAELFASAFFFSRLGAISTLGLWGCGSENRSTDTCDKLVTFCLFRTEASIVCTQYTPVMLVE
jgi:hypothetical protein